MIYIIIVYKGRKYCDIGINEMDTIKQILEIFYNKISMDQEERFYTKEKVIFKNGDTTLNGDEASLNKTAGDMGLEDNDTLELLRTEDMNAGKNN